MRPPGRAPGYVCRRWSNDDIQIAAWGTSAWCSGARPLDNIAARGAADRRSASSAGRSRYRATTRHRATDWYRERGGPGARPPMSLPYACLCCVRMLGVLAARCAVAGGVARWPGIPAANTAPGTPYSPRSSWLTSRPFHDHGGCSPAGGRKSSVIMVFHKARGDAGDDLAR